MAAVPGQFWGETGCIRVLVLLCFPLVEVTAAAVRALSPGSALPWGQGDASGCFQLRA